MKYASPADSIKLLHAGPPWWGAAVVHHLRLYSSMIETITEEQLTPQQAEFWVRARQAVDMNNYPYAVSLLKALVKQLPGFLEGRKALRACEIKLNPEAKRGGYSAVQ